MFFASDNSGPVHPSVIDALAAVNQGHVMAYGHDPVTERAVAMVRDVFEAPEAAVWFVGTGSAANALALACLSEPFDAICCSRVAHVFEDECNAPEFYTGGAKLLQVGAEDDKFTADELRTEFERWPRSLHTSQHGPVSITNVTERGTLYSLDEIRAISDVAHEQGVKLHLDGARFANACVALDVTAAEMTWKAGVDAVSFGGTKNGLMGVEAVVVFDPDLALDFELRRKRGGHLFSKGRYLAAQMEAYLTNDLWHDLARRSNASASRLVEGLQGTGRVDFLWEPQANMVFPSFAASAHRRLSEAGAIYHLWQGNPAGPTDADVSCRLVCDWSISDKDIDRFVDLVAA